MLFLFLLVSITFIIIAINKEEALFDNIAGSICLTQGLLILLVGAGSSLYMALKKPQISDSQN
ncbi:hypothetical protein ALGA_0010 [Labilibaculum antarcticum]|uniref:Uncharacterized protein n=1 Tax=Labilibaculum antarcticum TaxID=1717717 RepID=A0A1Y1CDJ4_9BACT|nr:hypothetical protein ALGA_0010 [Labilibaculum antarcticum]